MRFNADEGVVLVQDRDIVKLTDGREGVVTSVRQPSVREEYVGKLAINVTAKTQHAGIFDRLTVTPQAIVAVRGADGETWFNRSGEEIMLDGSQVKGKAVNLADAFNDADRAQVANGFFPNGAKLDDYGRKLYTDMGWEVGTG